jgi:hypothetical protein
MQISIEKKARAYRLLKDMGAEGSGLITGIIREVTEPLEFESKGNQTFNLLRKQNLEFVACALAEQHLSKIGAGLLLSVLTREPMEPNDWRRAMSIKVKLDVKGMYVGKGELPDPVGLKARRPGLTTLSKFADDCGWQKP